MSQLLGTGVALGAGEYYGFREHVAGKALVNEDVGYVDVTFSARDWVDSFDGSVPHLLADHVVERADNVAFANVPAPLAVVRGVVLKYSADAPPVDLGHAWLGGP